MSLGWRFWAQKSLVSRKLRTVLLDSDDLVNQCARKEDTFRQFAIIITKTSIARLELASVLG